ncbi:FGGY-family carbohydrate kinase [bacterium]|nr:FGGY-family carbohydrate kinase [bacterium]
MTASPDLFLGIDIGTGGVRALAVTRTGDVVARGATAFSLDATFQKRGDRHEQPPAAWWQALVDALRSLLRELSAAGHPVGSLRALAIDGTSGTLVCVDGAGQPLRPALMYNDGRAGTEAAELNVAAGPWCQKLGYRFGASYALARILWINRHEPTVFAATKRFVHQADYLVGRLSGAFGVTDYSNALKTGYDLVDERWPAWVAEFDGVRERLPQVVAPGSPLATISPVAAAATGLPAGLPIIAGVSDGTAGGIASGARRPGDGNSTLGTTLVFKAVSDRLCVDPRGLVYSHKLPNGCWLPGAASNVGAEWVGAWFGGSEPATLDVEAAALLPVAAVAYPLAHQGERFPFANKQAAGFCIPEVSGPERFAACLQGTAFVERLGYEVLEGLMSQPVREIYSTGAASRSDVWLQCRADVTGRVLCRPACPEAAFGAAILAAAGTVHGDLDTAVAAMVHVDRWVEPRANRAARYEELYGRFRAELRQRGYE